MRFQFRSLRLMVAGLGVLLAVATSAPAAEYTVTDLGILPDGLYSIASDINNRSQIVGYAHKPWPYNIYGFNRAFIYEAGQMRELPYPDGSHSYAKAINDFGQIAAEASVSGTREAFLDQLQLMTGIHGSSAEDVNNLGHVVGGDGCDSGAYIFMGVGNIKCIPWPSSVMSGVAYGINDLDEVVGRMQYYPDPMNEFDHAFLYRNGQVIDLGTLGGNESHAYDINEQGQVVGWAQTSGDVHGRGFIWQDGTMSAIPLLSSSGPTQGWANAINNLGQVVGLSWIALGSNHAFVWDSVNGTRDLNNLIPAGSGWEMRSATSINDWGQIVGEGLHNGLSRAFLLSPPPSIQLRDALGDTIPYANVTISRVSYNPPTYTEDTLGDFSSDALGVIEIDTSLIHFGDSIKVSLKAHTEPAVKHQADLGTMYTIFLDNMVIGSNSIPVFQELKDVPRQEAFMIHTTIAWSFLVSVEWDARSDYLTTLQSGFRGMANYLYDVSDGQMRLDTVKIYDNAAQWNDADFQIDASNITHPNADDVDAIQQAVGVVHMPRKWYGNEDDGRNNSYTENPLNLNDSVNYTTLAHEFGHYALGFYDEYQFWYNGAYSTDSGRCPSVPNYGYMDGQYPYPGYGPYRSELSSGARYALVNCQNNWHFKKLQMSCWDWFTQRFEKKYGVNLIFVPIKRPMDRNLPNNLDYLPGPNDILTSPDYNVGALVVFPVAISAPTALTYPATTFDANWGGAVANINVRVKIANTGKKLNQGNTSNVGQIRLLGIQQNDTVEVAGQISIGAPNKKVAFGGRVEETWGSLSGPMSDFLQADSLVLAVTPVAGDFRLLLLPAYGADNLTLRVLTRRALNAQPTVELTSDTDAATFPLVVLGSEYVSTFVTGVSNDGTMSLQTVDDSARSFIVPNDYREIAIDSARLPFQTYGPGGKVRLHIDSSGFATDSLLILESFFPVIRDGLDANSYQAGPAVGLAVKHAGQFASDNTLTLSYDDAVLNRIDFTLEESLRLFRWDESSDQWVLIGGSVDTALNEVSGKISLTGLYAAFTTQSPVDVGEENETNLPYRFELSQNYPNPFNPTTTIEYSIQTQSNVTIEIFNMLGQKVRTLVNETKSAGSYRIEWTGTDDAGKSVSTGVYLYRFQAGDIMQTKKMLLIK